jgi:uncharacterized protein (DUF1501 family)
LRPELLKKAAQRQDLRPNVFAQREELRSELVANLDLDSNGDLQMTADFRSVYATMIQEWMKFEGAPTVLKGNFAPLGVFA